MKWNTTNLDEINAYNRNTMMEFLEIRCTEITDDGITATMPVNHKTHQPMGLLHGGASAVLIESIGSIGSALLCDLKKEYPVGLEINANHIRGIKSGMVRAFGKVVHAGNRTHVWQVDIVDDLTNKLVCTGRLTVMIVQNSL